MPDQPIQPICFMIMPFGKKSTGIQSPAIVDFDELWNKAFKPALIALGYRPVRADQDTDSLIIHQMLERLYYSDVVIADISIANANVYYEVGIRHAARTEGCVLIAADWSRPVFDWPRSDICAIRSRMARLPMNAQIKSRSRLLIVLTRTVPEHHPCTRLYKDTPTRLPTSTGRKNWLVN